MYSNTHILYLILAGFLILLNSQSAAYSRGHRNHYGGSKIFFTVLV